MPFLQPRSVLQLVLVGFLVAIAPLCLAILYTIQTLGELSEKNRVVTDQIVAMNRKGQELQRDLLDLERRGRQYLTLKSDDLLTLFNREREAALYKLTELQQQFGNDPKIISELKTHISDLQPKAGNKLITQFDAITILRRELERWLQVSVDQRVTDHALEADSVKDQLLLMVFLLALAALILMLFFTYWINRPIRAIVKEIKQLGGGDLTHAIEISGPQEVRVLGQELEWLRQRLDEIDQQKQQFLRHISHELKTPLANLREGTDLLAEGVPGPLAAKQQEIIAIVQQNSIDLQRLIENLLDYNQLPDQSLKPDRIDLESLGKLILDNYRISIEHKRLKIVTQYRTKKWFTDRHRLKITLDNLISNAVNYTPEKGVIQVYCKTAGDKLIIAVANSGTPIPNNEAAHLFEPFYQGSSVRHGPIKGSGIGLSAARECMQALGGNLVLAKHPSLAVCFKLTCPALES